MRCWYDRNQLRRRQMTIYAFFLLAALSGCQSISNSTRDGTWHGYVFAENIQENGKSAVIYKLWVAQGPRVPGAETDAKSDEMQKRNPDKYSPILVNDDFTALELGGVLQKELVMIQGKWEALAAFNVHGTHFSASVLSSTVLQVQKMWDRYGERINLKPMN
jgi:hypothetical protein